MISAVIKIAICILFYAGMWMACTLIIIRSIRKNEGFDSNHAVVDGPASVFGLMLFWPIVAPIWIMFRVIKMADNMMQEEMKKYDNRKWILRIDHHVVDDDRVEIECPCCGSHFPLKRFGYTGHGSIYCPVCLKNTKGITVDVTDRNK